MELEFHSRNSCRKFYNFLFIFFINTDRLFSVIARKSTNFFFFNGESPRVQPVVHIAGNYDACDLGKWRLFLDRGKKKLKRSKSFK